MRKVILIFEDDTFWAKDYEKTIKRNSTEEYIFLKFPGLDAFEKQLPELGLEDAEIIAVLIDNSLEGDDLMRDAGGAMVYNFLRRHDSLNEKIIGRVIGVSSNRQPYLDNETYIGKSDFNKFIFREWVESRGFNNEISRELR
jgi:hypothetical protein